MTDMLRSEESAARPSVWTCAACRSPYRSGEIYCSHCGSLLPHVLAARPELHTAPFMVEAETAAAEAGIPTTAYFHEKARLYLHLDDGISFNVPFRDAQAMLGRRSPGGTQTLNAQPAPELIDLTPFNAAALGVSRQHAMLEVDQNLLYVVDLHSVNGTYINSRHITPGARYPLNNRALLQLGGLVLRVHYV